jgi:signal transduction histidine kinase
LWIWEHDLASGKIAWHEPFEGSIPEETSFRAVLRRVLPEYRHVVCDAVRKAQRTGVYDAEYRITRPDGVVVWMNSWGQVVEYPQRKMIGVSLDVTARKDSETLIREKDRLAASAEIAGSLAHEINNPLTSILGAMYMLGLKPQPDPAAARFLEIANMEAHRVAQLANQILGLYRPPGSRVPIDIRSLLADVIANCQAELDAKHQNIHLRTRYCGMVSGHREELVHGFSNILRNAIESSPPGSQIYIRAHLARSAVNGESWGVRVLFADAGQGIPVNALAGVFDPFKGTKPQKGTGLGLWVARGAVIKHGGTIRIRTARGERSGTVVSVFLSARSRSKAATPDRSL